MIYWYNKGNNCISLYYYIQHWKLVSIGTNGAIKGRDKCYDFNIHFLGFHFSYTNFNFSPKKI